MKKTIQLIIATLSLCGVSQGAVVLTHHYSLGEVAGDVTDSVGSSDFDTGTAPGSALGGASATIGSTAHATYGAGEFSSGADFSSLATDNIAISVWFRTAALPTGGAQLFRTNESNGGPDLLIHRGDDFIYNAWGSSKTGISWIGPNRGVDGSVIANTWAQLAFVRDNGTATFYLNGVAQGPTSGATIAHGLSGALGDISGASAIDVDDLRIYTFANGEGAAAVAASALAVPEPSSSALLGLGGLALVLRRRK